MFRSEDPGEGGIHHMRGHGSRRLWGVSRPFRGLQDSGSGRNTPTAGAVVLPSSGMAQRQVLVAVSAAQLALGVAGLAIALRRGHCYDHPLMRGRPEHIVRDSLWMGTALSAPVVMLAAQALAIRALRSGPDDGARRALGALGVTMTGGYLIERLCRRRLTPRGFDPVETPVVVAGLVGAAAMGVLGHRAQAGR